MRGPEIFVPAAARRLVPSAWDLVALLLVVGTLAAIGRGASEASAALKQVEAAGISLAPIHLPEYALRTTLRMFAALAASILFTFSYATLAAKSRRAEWVLVPLLDILQSVPVLGFLTFTVTGFMALFPGKVLGLECAAVFAIFTSQAWNMAFSFFQSLKATPADLDEVCRGFGLNGWQRFWRLEVPYAMPGLIWNMMMSMSGGWFFVVASESITVGSRSLALPGIGSYVAAAIAERNLKAVGWAVLTMLAVIAAYDQLLFRPLVAWADKFRFELSASAPPPRSWVLVMLERSRLVGLLIAPLRRLGQMILRLGPRRTQAADEEASVLRRRLFDGLWLAVVATAGGWLVRESALSYLGALDWADLRTAVLDGTITLVRVIVLMILASLIWVPIGVRIGLNPRAAAAVQPMAQFLAAFPANLLFPVAVVVIVKFHLAADVWLSPLMILGTQWYILFNVIAGASAFPNDLKEAAANFRIRGGLWWRTVILPGIFPYYLTGALTASGGSWNASIVAEFVTWGDTQVTAHGLGADIARATAEGDPAHVMLGVVVMAVFVTGFNRLLWRPLYRLAERRYKLA